MTRNWESPVRSSIGEKPAMGEVNRREAVKLAMSLGVAGAVAKVALAEETPVSAPSRALEDRVQGFLVNPGSYMFGEEITTKLDDSLAGLELVITSAAPDRRGNHFVVRTHSAQIFQANADIDEFTKQGGVY
ncbi:hypothetical protein SH668x_003657 [Planctomicrobium sp. SH668]|uniref:hypothetical protein n=1 Tax=Planctomicrobium sp. SH668 TaxID=3448126 RepID=UPI003F5BCFA1